MKKFKTIGQMVQAMKSGEIPENVVSPGAAAQALGITRQSVHSRLLRETLTGWSAEGVILIDARSLKSEVNKKFNIPAGQGELNVTT